MIEQIYKEDPLSAAVVDLIINDDCFERDEETEKYYFSINKLAQLVYQFNKDYYDYFSKRYNLIF